MSEEFHGKTAAALCHGAELGRITKHFGKRHLGIDNLDRTPIVNAFDAALREFKSPVTSPMKLSGTKACTFMTGSRITGFARRAASWNAIEPAILNAASDESTSWKEPS